MVTVPLTACCPDHPGRAFSCWQSRRCGHASCCLSASFASRSFASPDEPWTPGHATGNGRHPSKGGGAVYRRSLDYKDATQILSLNKYQPTISCGYSRHLMMDHRRQNEIHDTFPRMSWGGNDGQPELVFVLEEVRKNMCTEP